MITNTKVQSIGELIVLGLCTVIHWKVNCVISRHYPLVAHKLCIAISMQSLKGANMLLKQF